MIMSNDNYKKIKEYLDDDDALFNTLTITIPLVGCIDNSDDPSKKYIISKLECSNTNNSDFKDIQDYIDTINTDILNKDNTGYKSADKGTGWSIFFLIKELIQFLSSKPLNFNYYRGQRNGKWKTLPSAFRNIENDSSVEYYLEFENIYKEIYQKYPEKISYYKFPETSEIEVYNNSICERGQQLSLLQHYELYTPLLDITSNPYIALLFMTNGELIEPQLEFYDVSNTPLFMEPIKSQLNNRIFAQKGAFLNYEMLLSKNDKNDTVLAELKNDSSLKIPRVILKIKYQEKETLKYYKKMYSSINRLKQIRDISTEDTIKILLDENISMISSLPRNKKKLKPQVDLTYKHVQKHLRRKLFEFKYLEDDLFPDFEDFLKNKMKLYKVQKEF